MEREVGVGVVREMGVMVGVVMMMVGHGSLIPFTATEERSIVKPGRKQFMSLEKAAVIHGGR